MERKIERWRMRQRFPIVSKFNCCFLLSSQGHPTSKCTKAEKYNVANTLHHEDTLLSLNMFVSVKKREISSSKIISKFEVKS